MSERPTQTPASSAPQPAASRASGSQVPANAARHGVQIDERRSGGPSPQPARSAPSVPAGESLAERAARFRSGAPFLVERATLYDPDPLDLPVAPADRRPSAPRTLLPAALTLLGVVIVVGLAAGVLFVRNADGPRHAEEPSRLERFSERVVPRPSDAAPLADAPTRRDQVMYDLTRRSNDTIVGAWRLQRELERRRAEETKASQSRPPAPPPEPAPEVVTAPPEKQPSKLQRLMPKRLTGWLEKRKQKDVAEPAAPERAPLDEPHVPKSTADARPAAAPSRAPLDDPYVSRRGTDSRPVAMPQQRSREAARQQGTPNAAEPSGPNVVARVGRAADPKEKAKEAADRDDPTPREISEAEEREAARRKVAARRAQRADMRRQREARRVANDLDRFRLRDQGEGANGFVFSGPQGQRP